MCLLPSSSYSEAEQELLNTLESVCQDQGISVNIDPEEFNIVSPAAIDVEHDEEGNLVGIGVYDGKSSLYFTEVRDSLVSSLLGCGLVAHNGKGDIESLRQWGIPILDTQLIHDTMLIGHIIDSSLKSYGLKDMALRELGIAYPSYDDIVGRRTKKQKVERRTLDKWPVEIVARYNACDTWVTWKLYLLQKQINEKYH